MVGIHLANGSLVMALRTRLEYPWSDTNGT